MSDGKAALQGVLQAHTLALPALVNDMLWRHNAGVANDALEAAAAEIEKAPGRPQAELAGAIRALKVAP